MKCLFCLQPFRQELFLSNYLSAPRQLCSNCESSLQPLKGERCPHCRRRLDGTSCSDCLFMHRYFPPLDDIHILYDYNDFMKELIHCYKGRGDIRLAAVFADRLKPHAKFLKSYDRLVPLPTSRDKLKMRGFSQMETILTAGGYRYQQPLDMAAREKQSALTKKERLGQVNPFTLTAPVSGRVLLIDDIYTTGLTVHRAAEVLRAGGAEEVGVLAFARP